MAFNQVAKHGSQLANLCYKFDTVPNKIKCIVATGYTLIAMYLLCMNFEYQSTN